MKTLTGQDLKEMLEELYRYYFLEFRKSDKDDRTDTPETIYNDGQNAGSMNTVGSIYLALYGGGDMYKLWQDCLKEADEKYGK